jgi:flagellar assembly factor FliW
MMAMDEQTGDSVVTFPEGIPGFEESRRYLIVTSPEIEPFTCVYGAEPGAPSFLAIDPRRAEASFPCRLETPDRTRLRAGADATLLWLALVTPGTGGPTVNLRAPLVINPETMLGLQVVSDNDLPMSVKLRSF